jgi:hypothetical protein
MRTGNLAPYFKREGDERRGYYSPLGAGSHNVVARRPEG